MSKKIATIAYLKELYKKLGHTLSTTKDNTYCPTYGEITGSEYYLNSSSNKNNYGFFIGSQYSVDGSTDGKYEPNQCVCEIDIMAMKPSGLTLSIIQSGTTNYGDSGTVDCMVTYDELISGETPYNDKAYLKLDFKYINYQKKDDGQNITSGITNIDVPSSGDGITYKASAVNELRDNKSTDSKTYYLFAQYKGKTSRTITIYQLGETYGYYADSGQTVWIDAEDYPSSTWYDYTYRLTKGWLDDYGDNIGTTGGTNSGRDIYNTDKTDYRRGIEVTTNIKPESYTNQSTSGTSYYFGDSLPLNTGSTTYHIAFADDANTNSYSYDSFHWLFKEEGIGSYRRDFCSGGKSPFQCSLAGGSYRNIYDFYSNRDYFKPQHCYGKTSIDRIYKKDINGNIRKDEFGIKMIDKGFSKNPIDHLQGEYPLHWRRQIATYTQYQPWGTLTADIESKAKITIYEKTEGGDYNPSHRLVNGEYRVSSGEPYYDAVVVFPDNTDGNETYYAYPLFHYLSPEICEFDDEDEKTTYHRKQEHNLTNYEGGGSGKTYAYNMSIGASGSPMIQDYGYNYLTYNEELTYGGECCPTDQFTRSITYIKEYKPKLRKFVFWEDVDRYVGGGDFPPTVYNAFIPDDKNYPLTGYETTIPYYDSSMNYITEKYKPTYYVRTIEAGTKYAEITDTMMMPYDHATWGMFVGYADWITVKQDETVKWWLSIRSDGKILEKVTSAATAPYQTITFRFYSNDENNDNITAKITGDLSSKSTVNVNAKDQIVTVNIDYGTDFTVNAYTGDLVVTDGSHTLTYPIGRNESITMKTARDIASKGYAPMNDEDNYWCTTVDGKGDINQEVVSTPEN